MTHLQIWLQNHNRRLTQASIDEALMEYITHIEAKIADLQAENELLKQVEANLAESLRAWKAEIEKQEPVAWEWVTPEKGMQISHTEPAEYEEVYHLKPLFATPVVSPDVEKLKAEIVSLRQQIRASQSNVMARDEYIQSLTTELVAALKDAERYRWLRTAPKADVVVAVAPDEYFSPYGNELDAHIDAAIEQAKGGV